MQKLKLMLPVDELDDNTLEQAERIAKMNIVVPYVVLMPDAHYGKGACVGSVVPTRGAIMPAAVGVDIGCGMIAYKTDVHADELGDLKELREAIEEAVPSSAGNYNDVITESASEKITELIDYANSNGVSQDRYDELDKNWKIQLGTLGGGNHFIEVSTDPDGMIWVVIHSGSRGIGHKIATKYIAIAKQLMEDYLVELEDDDLAYIPQSSHYYSEYRKDLSWAQEFAKLNREEMMERTLEQLEKNVGRNFQVLQAINCHHNYAANEKVLHWKDTIVTRKGAISAREGELGIIPGSMGDKTYIVEGKGNALALNSAPHGAGRAMSRTKAREKFTMDDFDDMMGDIEYRHSDKLLDEIPAAYKDIDDVMKYSSTLVNVRTVLKQVVNVKGN